MEYSTGLLLTLLHRPHAGDVLNDRRCWLPRDAFARALPNDIAIVRCAIEADCVVAHQSVGHRVSTSSSADEGPGPWAKGATLSKALTAQADSATPSAARSSA